ncbi:polyadenylation and cleavage factor homolog 11-like [Panonychus citri]|uniref:polyadenylation and cleavage factor homolog 11-like n=1 Tax=Panonychus citri TaxID=50023 RepID=UPI0023079A24|nr:polyadenylation and cleavage factor homolog 11-like [Panonychus citri]
MSSLREALLEYHNSLEELTFNSKTVISMLTMVAAEFDEIPEGPPNIVDMIAKRVTTVDIKQKLPVLYLIDSICKNIGKPFTELFEKKIVDVFKHVFEEGDETTRQCLYKLRKTWIGIFSDYHLHEIDSAAQSIDPAWPSIPTNPGPPAAKRKKENLDSTSSAVSKSKRSTIPISAPPTPSKGSITTPVAITSQITTLIPPQATNGLLIQPQAQILSPLQPMTTSNHLPSLNFHSSSSKPQSYENISQHYCQVDGNTVKLFFIDENTSIVLMKDSHHLSLNELVKINPYDLEPRLIMFEVKQTKVYIDNGKNESRKIVLFYFKSKTFFHGQHAQSIRLGGPCREIILNGKPYQVSFGGPPINVRFLGDSHQTHTLRLGGPPPRVKISDEIRVDLWVKYVDKFFGRSDENSIQITNPFSPLPSAQPLSLPSNLGPSSSSQWSKSMSSNQVTLPIAVSNSKPSTDPPDNLRNLLNNLISVGLIPPSEKRVSSIDEIESEPLLLETKSLKADHPKVIADLINGTQCPNCSLRFEVGDSNERSKYSVHLDWHFRLNRQERTDSKSKSAAVRRWFCHLDLWVSFKEITDETDEMNLDTEKEENDCGVGGEKKVYTVSANEDETLNVCAVCKEKFETSWNEDEEEWQLLNAVKGQDEKIYHPLCLEDLEN